MDFAMIEAGWPSILPPVIAIVLAFVTKEVYSSLFIGVVSGMLIYAFAGDGNLVSATAMTFDMMSSKIADNAYMIIFLALLWAVVSLVSKSGGSQAYGRWAGAKLKTKRSALFATSLLGVLIFIDDGFNCLTVGTVMRPITDRLRISREKLAYIIDATAAPVCIIAPVSSWAVAVASEVSEKNGFNVFLSTIPYNFYALMTILMVFFISFTNSDFGPMKRAEEKARTRVPEEETGTESGEAKGRVIDLALPIVVLIVCAILGMAYVGGFFEGVSFSEAIGYNPTAGLSLGAFAGLLCAMLLYLPRKLMSPREFIECIVSGIANIVPPMLILILSWSLGGVCRQLIGTGVFISGFVNGSNLPMGFLPFLIFVIAALMSFSMGTSWGTFGMLIPIVTMICETEAGAGMLIPALSATLAGSVYGDHCSPISDTTILSSTGADCKHLRHVETQLPYATLVAVVCAIGYLIAGFTGTPVIALAVGTILLIGAIMVLSRSRRSIIG
ncbi:MAG: Na+/H+ antiporter NhaC family protein [Eubacterium sp.]|nr:Na+/H+ antiporter NhaC family protein [Eubacterium sp.]MBQ6363418.1 Na+/H+ antiporter NhaC family protein [Lachnospiraceae bacterium]